MEEGGCAGNTQVTVSVIPTPEMGYLTSQTHGCAPLNVSFMQDVKDAISYTWNFGDGSPVSNELTPFHTYSLPGVYVVTLTASNIGGCEASISSILIEVSDPGAAEFSSDPGFPVDMTLPNTEVHFVDMSENAVKWVWNFGDGGYSNEVNPTYTYNQEGLFEVTLTVTTTDGCISQMIHGSFVVKSPDLAIPNVFSPNGDGINDTWIVMYSGSQPFTAQIFDRWGGKYYESRNKTMGWDGSDMNGATVPEGVYFYKVVVGGKEYAGEVTLIR
jgi:gliding motility-associated-like protein